MDAYESILWIIRLFVVLIVTVVLVMLLSIFIPDVETQQLTADIIASRVVYSGGTYIVEPGVIDTSLFRQGQADEFVDIHPQTPLAVKTWLLHPETKALIGEPIVYNDEQYDFLSRKVTLGHDEVTVDRRELPVLITNNRREIRKPAIQIIEVLYE